MRRPAAREKQAERVWRKISPIENNPQDQSGNVIDVSVADFDDLHFNSDSDTQGREDGSAM
jgi:hypothetical protein